MTVIRAEEPRALGHRLSECNEHPQVGSHVPQDPIDSPQDGPRVGAEEGCGDSGTPGGGSNDKLYCRKWCPLGAY